MNAECLIDEGGASKAILVTESQQTRRRESSATIKR